MCLSNEVPSERRGNTGSGFTLIELMVVIAIIGLMMGIAIPGYQSFIEKGKAAETAATMLEAQTKLEIHFAQYNTMPETLTELGMNLKDEWGNDFVYVPFEGHPENLSFARNTQVLVLLNTDYDLWSPGKDGISSKSITAEAALDDIIRADNGAYFGLAKKY